MLVALCGVVSACSMGFGSAPSPSPKPSARATAPMSAQIAREAANPNPNFDYGFVIQATATGFHPHWLVAACCHAITWRNLTSGPVTIQFDHQPVRSPVIPPGGDFVFVPRNVESITYHDAGQPSQGGVVQVNQTFES